MILRVLTCFVLLFAFCVTQVAQNSKVLDNYLDKIEQFVANTDSTPDAIRLRRFYENTEETLPHPQKNLLQRIYMIRLAQLYANNNEGINDQSATLITTATRGYPEDENNDIMAWLFTQAAFYYYSFNRYDLALPYFLQARRLLDNFSDDKRQHPMLGEAFMKNAFFAGTIGDTIQVLPYLQAALKHTPRTSPNYGTILNALGMYYFNRGSLDEAMEYHHRTKTHALSINDSIRYAKALGEMAQIHFKRKEYTKAEELLIEDIAVSKRNGDERNTMFAQILLGKIYIFQNEVFDAEKTLNEANTYAKSKSHLKSFEYQITKALIQIAQIKNDDRYELELRRKLNSLETAIAETEGDVVVNNINMQLQKENFDNQLQLEKSMREKEEFEKLAIGIIAVLLFLGSIFLFLALKRKLKIRESEYHKMVISSQLDKTKSEKKLIETHNSLVAYQTYLTEKNEQIRRLEDKIHTLSESPQLNKFEKNNHELEKLLESHLMTDENWQTFKNTFIREDYSTYKKLIDQFPGITESALRIELIQALGMNNAETARVLGLTIDAVKKSKQRLRKKTEKSE